MAQTFENLRFLIVDDMKVMRVLVKQQLRRLRVENVDEYEDAADAWEALITDSNNANKVQFIISDWNMPKMKGIQLLRNCRAHKAYKDMAFVMLTGETDIETVKEVISAGVDQYINKPFTPDTFDKKIFAAFKKRFPSLPKPQKQAA